MNGASFVSIAAPPQRVDPSDVGRIVERKQFRPAPRPLQLVYRSTDAIRLAGKVREIRRDRSPKPFALSLEPACVFLAAGVLGAAKKLAAPTFDGLAQPSSRDVGFEQRRVDRDRVAHFYVVARRVDDVAERPAELMQRVTEPLTRLILVPLAT